MPTSSSPPLFEVIHWGQWSGPSRKIGLCIKAIERNWQGFFELSKKLTRNRYLLNEEFVKSCHGKHVSVFNTVVLSRDAKDDHYLSSARGKADSWSPETRISSVYLPKPSRKRDSCRIVTPRIHGRGLGRARLVSSLLTINKFDPLPSSEKCAQPMDIQTDNENRPSLRAFEQRSLMSSHQKC